eukprot:1147577-Prymnesium_polylepis.1
MFVAAGNAEPSRLPGDVVRARVVGCAAATRIAAEPVFAPVPAAAARSLIQRDQRDERRVGHHINQRVQKGEDGGRSVEKRGVPERPARELGSFWVVGSSQREEKIALASGAAGWSDGGGCPG